MENNVFSCFALDVKSRSDERALAPVQDMEDLPTCISPPPNWRAVIQAIRQKAKNLKAIAQKLLAPPFNGCVPCTMDELLTLPGVGPKVALLVLWVAFEKGEEGFIVDTNVRRVCCRLGWVPEGSDPSQVRAAIETWLPKSLWPDLSFLFVGFGQQVCKPTAPQCEKCHVKGLCPNALQDNKGGTAKKKSRMK